MWLPALILLSPLIFQIISILFQPGFKMNEMVQSAADIEGSNNSDKSQDAEFTPDEKRKIEQLRKLMGDELQLDFEKCGDFLVRWLQECDMDLSCATEWLKNTLKWRRSILVDVMQSNTTFVENQGPTVILQGRTKDDGPILFITPDGFDMRKIMLSSHKQDFFKTQLQFIERYFQESIRRAENGEIKLIPGIIVVNGRGFSLKQHACPSCFRFFRDLFRITEANYLRGSKFIVIINAPTIARPSLELIRSLLTPYKQKVFKVFGQEKEEWSSFLLKYIAKQELLAEFDSTMINKI